MICVKAGFFQPLPQILPVQWMFLQALLGACRPSAFAAAAAVM